MCGDWWISIPAFVSFVAFAVCRSLLAVMLIKGNEKRNRKRQEKGSKYDKNKEQVDIVHKPNQHLIIESRYNLTVGLFIL